MRLDALVRARPRDLDRDADGAIVMRGQIVALAPRPAALQAAQSAGFVVAEQRRFDALGLRVVVLRAPPGLATQQAMQRLRQLDPQGEYVITTFIASPRPARHLLPRRLRFRLRPMQRLRFGWD